MFRLIELAVSLNGRDSILERVVNKRFIGKDLISPETKYIDKTFIPDFNSKKELDDHIALLQSQLSEKYKKEDEEMKRLKGKDHKGLCFYPSYEEKCALSRKERYLQSRRLQLRRLFKARPVSVSLCATQEA